MTQPTLIMRLVEMRAENVDLKSIVAGLQQFKADLEAQGVAVSITIESWQVPIPMVIVETESQVVND